MRQPAYRIGAPVVEPVVVSIGTGDRETPSLWHIRGLNRHHPRTEKTIPASIARRAIFAAPLLTLPALADDATAMLAGLERRSGGRLGVAALDTASGRRTGHRADERFPLCSTFKFLAAALVLARVDRGQERLDRRVVFSERDLVTYSPTTKDHVGPGGHRQLAVRVRGGGGRVDAARASPVAQPPCSPLNSNTILSNPHCELWNRKRCRVCAGLACAREVSASKNPRRVSQWRLM